MHSQKNCSRNNIFSKNSPLGLFLVLICLIILPIFLSHCTIMPMVISLGAPILSFEEFDAIRNKCGKIIATSGYFDPIHPGHISSFTDSKKLGDTLVVIVNGDAAARMKKGKAFQDLATRCSIVSGIKGVDYVIPFEIENDPTVCVALRKLQPHIYTKGGDRNDFSKLAETSVCNELGIQMVGNVGLDKHWSSSTFIKEWEEFLESRNK